MDQSYMVWCECGHERGSGGSEVRALQCLLTSSTLTPTARGAQPLPPPLPLPSPMQRCRRRSSFLLRRQQLHHVRCAGCGVTYIVRISTYITVYLVSVSFQIHRIHSVSSPVSDTQNTYLPSRVRKFGPIEYVCDGGPRSC